MKAINIKKIAVAIGALVMSSSLFAQQQAQFTQYMYNTQMINPAYSGTNGKLDAYFIHRSQWVGIEDAPRTQNFGVSAGIGKIIGLGLNVVNDRLGPSNLTTFSASVAAKINLTNDIKISLGINGGMDMLSVDWGKGQSMSDNDDAMLNNIHHRLRPVIGAGVYLYSDKWYFGVSSPTFIQKDRYGKDGEAGIDERIHLYAIGGYVFDLGENVKLKPAILMKGVQGAPITVDLALNTLIKDQFTAGLGYRYNDAVYLLLGYTFKKCLFIGYSYDMNVSKLRGYSSGSHDIMLKYTLWPKENGVVSPRFF